MTTGHIDIFMGDSETPIAWFEIDHDAYNCDNGFGSWLRETLTDEYHPMSVISLYELIKKNGFLREEIDDDEVIDVFCSRNICDEGPYTKKFEFTDDDSVDTTEYRARIYSDGSWKIEYAIV